MNEPTPLPRPPDLGYRYVTSPEELAACVATLAGTSVLAVDIEGDSFFSYNEKTCLVQITGDRGPDWVIDPLQVRDLTPLRAIVEDRSVVKVFHGADYDVVSLKRDHGFAIGPIFDTMIAAQASGHDRFGLQDLVQRYFGVHLDKRYQRHDWSSRPLRPEHLEYARYDTHFLPALMGTLRAQAEARGRAAMLAEEFALLEARAWTGRPFDADDCLRIKGATRLPEQGQRVVRAVFALRDGIAASKDRPPFKVWGNDVLLKLGKSPPRTKDELLALLGDKSHVVRRYADDVLAAVEAGLADTTRIPGRKPYEPPTRNLDVPPFEREDEALYAHLKGWRNDRAEAEQLAPAMIVNNTVLKLLTALKPADTGALALIDDMRGWQRAEYGEELVAVVQEYLLTHPPEPPREPVEGEGGEGRRRRRRRRRRRGGGGAAVGAPGE